MAVGCPASFTFPGLRQFPCHFFHGLVGVSTAWVFSCLGRVFREASAACLRGGVVAVGGVARGGGSKGSPGSGTHHLRHLGQVAWLLFAFIFSAVTWGGSPEDRCRG